MAGGRPIYVYRFTHVENLHILLRRGGLHAPHFTPDDGLIYKTIHNVEIQSHRNVKPIPCKPGGVIHDYVPFYFCNRSPMLYQLFKGGVKGYDEGQVPLIYLVSSVQSFVEAGVPYVFSDGHGIAVFTEWFCGLTDLDKLDWNTIHARYWADTIDDMDRKRRKQAEFLVHKFCPWSLILGIAVINAKMSHWVEAVLSQFPVELQKKVFVRRDWYY